MNLEQLLPELAGLTRTEKFKVVQSLISELAGAEGGPLPLDGVYPVWSPLQADEAAATLLQLLRVEEVADVRR